MTTHHRHLTRALMIVALAVGAWTAAEAASHDTAVAADMPSAEHPGGVLGGRLLSERASDVAEAVAELPGRIVDPKPADEPEPREEPAQEPTEPADEEPPTDDRPAEPPADPIVEVPPLDPPPITVDPVVVDPIVIDVPPVVVPVPPVVIPALPAEPAPGTPSFGPIVSPPTAGPIGEPVPQPVPAVIGPAPDDETAQTTVAAGAALEVPPCSSSRPAPDRGRGAGGAVTDQGSGLSATRPALPLRGGCPSVPDGGDNALNLVAMKPPSGSAVDLIADQAALLVGDPAMVRLGVLRPRSHLPAGSPTRIDPRPA